MSKHKDFDANFVIMEHIVSKKELYSFSNCTAKVQLKDNLRV